MPVMQSHMADSVGHYYLQLKVHSYFYCVQVILLTSIWPTLNRTSHGQLLFHTCKCNFQGKYDKIILANLLLFAKFAIFKVLYYMMIDQISEIEM